MKLRNQLLALACLIAFIGMGVLYFRIWVVQKPFGIILFVGDGLVTRNLTAARLYHEGGAGHRLALDSFPNLAVAANYANDYAVPDSASAATAIATGVKVNNRAIALDPHGNELKSILELAREQGRVVGLITNGNITDAGAAAFYAHVGNCDEVESIAAQFATADLDVALGGGSADLTPASEGGFRKDGRDLILEMRDKGRQIVRNKAELENATAFGGGLVGLFSAGNMAFSNQIESGSQQPSLSDMVRRAIQVLQSHESGYFLVVDSELYTRAAEQNDGERALRETLNLDHAVQTALDYAGPNSLIVAAGRHATGGMIMNGYPLRQDSGVALLGKNANGYPSITWATGPNGPRAGGSAFSVSAAAASAPPAPNTSGTSAGASSEPAAFYAPAAINCADDMIVVGIGPGSQRLKGFIDNTFVYEVLEGGL